MVILIQKKKYMKKRIIGLSLACLFFMSASADEITSTPKQLLKHEISFGALNLFGHSSTDPVYIINPYYVSPYYYYVVCQII